MQYDLAEFALKMVAPNNKLIYDDKGIPSVMVYVPKFKMSDVIDGAGDSTHPAFIVNGKEVPGIWISKYQNIVNNGRAYSLPGQDPTVNITWDTARGYCESKGKGWHMMTKAEWAAIMLWCKKNGFQPWGNNNYGKDSRETLQQAIPATYGSDGKINHVLTGTGPLTWSHNKQLDGIWDLNGNVSEWTGALRTVKESCSYLKTTTAPTATIRRQRQVPHGKPLMQRQVHLLRRTAMEQPRTVLRSTQQEPAAPSGAKPLQRP